ncbi:MAG TPA: FHA domain-containing protein, partial [Chloroflexota bacterium]|nr:FHA domain-containing protein [Chloroflexota bacterium]
GPLLAAAAGLGLVAFIGIVVGVVMLSSRRPPAPQAPQAPPAPSPAPPPLPPRSDATEVIDRTEVMDRTVVSAPVDDGATLIAGPGRQPPSLPKGKLHIVQLGTESEVILSQSETVLGREASNPVVLKDPLASRRHARIILENGDYWIEDLKSLNGTRVNGEVLSERRKLASNDQIKIGDIVLTFMLESGK